MRSICIGKVHLTGQNGVRITHTHLLHEKFAVGDLLYMLASVIRWYVAEKLLAAPSYSTNQGWASQLPIVVRIYESGSINLFISNDSSGTYWINQCFHLELQQGYFHWLRAAQVMYLVDLEVQQGYFHWLHIARKTYRGLQNGVQCV